MSDDNKNDVECNNKEQVNDCTPTHIDVSNEQNEISESNGIDPQVDEHIRELLNILIDQDVDSGTKKESLQGKMERKKALTKLRRRKHDQVMLLEQFHVYKQYFEESLNEKKVSDDDKKNKTYKELCKMLTSPKSLYEERAKFYQATKSHDESLDQFFQRLTDLSSNCQFGERRSAVIADKLILSQSNIYYAFCTEGQKEVRGKKALKMTKKIYDQNVMVHYELYEPSYLRPHRRLLNRRSLFQTKQSKNVPPHLAEMIRNEIMEKDLSVEWDDIAGLDFPKTIIKESIVWPMIRPDIFTGLRKLPKAMLLFGPPGTGKTMMAKCIAAQSKSTFFYVSASTMASKWHGESEQLVRALFTIAAEHQPSIIFFDEVDSMLTQRSKREQEVNRRVKTEFMIQLDGAITKDDAKVIFIGATNRPQDLDEAARRRFVKRLYVPLPDLPARRQLLNILLKDQSSNLNDYDVNEIASMTNEFSGADIKWLCQDAAMEPLRSIPIDKMMVVEVKDIRPLEMKDFVTSLKRIRPSVASADLTAMVEWDRLYGTNSERPSDIDNHFMYS